MKFHRECISWMLVLVIGAGCANPQASEPAPVPSASTEPRTAVFDALEDDVQARPANTSTYAPAALGDMLPTGGQARTGETGRAALLLSPEMSIVRLGPATGFTLTGLSPRAEDFFANLWLQAGQLWIILAGGSLDVETPVGTASVRGSYLGVSFDPYMFQMTATCLEGVCSLANSLGTTGFGSGQAADILGQGQAPGPARPMTEDEYLQWLDNNPEAVDLPAPAMFGLPSLYPVTVLEPGAGWPTAPAAFQVTYPDPSGDSENCFFSYLKIPDPSADIIATTVTDLGGEFLVVDVLVEEYSDSVYDVFLTLYWLSPNAYADYMAEVTPDLVTLFKRDATGEAPPAPGEIALTGQTLDGYRVFRFVVANMSDTVSTFIISLFHLEPEPDICDHQDESP